MKDFRNYWNDGCNVLSMREGYNSELPTFEVECKTEEEASQIAFEWQTEENKEYNQRIQSKDI